MSTIASTGGGQSTGGGSTGYSGGSSISSTGAQSMGWGDDWRQRLVTGSTDAEKELGQLQRYESPEQVWRKARELERKLSSGMLPKDASDVEKAAWRTANGIPAKPEDYKINLPAGKQAPKEDDKFLKAQLKSFHEAGFTQAQVDGAIANFYSSVDQTIQERQDDEKQLELACEESLRQAWQGGDFKVNKSLAQNLLNRAPPGFKDKFMNGYLEDGTPIKAAPEAWKWLVQLEREINPAATILPPGGGDHGQTIEAELKELLAMSTAQKGSAPYKKYWEDGGEKRYRDLVELRDRLAARAA